MIGDDGSSSERFSASSASKINRSADSIRVEREEIPIKQERSISLMIFVRRECSVLAISSAFRIVVSVLMTAKPSSPNSKIMSRNWNSSKREAAMFLQTASVKRRPGILMIKSDKSASEEAARISSFSRRTWKLCSQAKPVTGEKKSFFGSPLFSPPSGESFSAGVSFPSVHRV